MAALDAAAAEEAEPGVVEVVAVEIVDHHHRAGRAHEGLNSLSSKNIVSPMRGELIAIVAADRAGLGDRVVGLADAECRQQRDVAEYIGRQHQSPAGCSYSSRCGCRVDHACHLRAVLSVVSRLTTAGAQRDFGSCPAAEHASMGPALALPRSRAFAEAAVLAAARVSPRVGVGWLIVAGRCGNG